MLLYRESLTATCSDFGGRGINSSADNRKGSIDLPERSAGSVKKNSYVDLHDKQLAKGAKIIDEEKHHIIPSLSPSLKSASVSEISSVTASALKFVDSMVQSHNEKGFTRGNKSPLIYSGLAFDCSSIRIDGLMPQQVESCISPSDNINITCVGASVVGKVEDTLLLDTERLECSLPKDKLLVLDGANGEKHEPHDSQDDQWLSSSSFTELRQDASHVEAKSVLPQQTVDRAAYLVSHIARGLSEGSLEEAASCVSGEGSSLQQSFTSCTVALDHSFDPSPATYDRTTDDFNMTSTCCSNVKESCGKLSEGGMVYSKLDPMIVFRQSNPKRVASLRNKQMDAKPNHLTRKKSKSRKYKTAAYASSSLSIRNKTTRKRSCFDRMARRSLWGQTSSLITSFMVNDEPGASSFGLDLIQNKHLKRTPYGSAKEEIQTGNGGDILKSLQNQLSFSTNSLHLKDQNNLQLNFPKIVDSHCSLEGSSNSLPNLSCNTEVSISNIHGEAGEPLTHMLAHGVLFVQQDGQQTDKDIESTVTQDVSFDDMLGECPGISSEVGLEALVHTVVDKQLLDQESSPGSDIYNPVDCAIPTDTDSLKVHDSGEHHESVLPLDMLLLQTGNKKVLVMKVEKARQKAYGLYEDTLINDKFQNPKAEGIAAEPLKYVRKKHNGLRGKNLVSLESKSEAIMKTSMKSFLGEAGLDNNEECLQELDPKIQTLPEMSIRNIPPEGGSSMSDKIKGKKVSKSSEMGLVRSKSTKTDSSRQHRLKSFDKKKHVVKLDNRRNKKKNQMLDASQSLTLTCNELELKNNTTGLDSQFIQKRQAWVLCDDCQKWRCIPTALADTIEQTNCSWTCKNNTDMAFADCSILQEKTNSEINAELEIADASCDEDALKQNSVLAVTSKIANQQAPWAHVKSNFYLHRNRKSQTIDEIMVCHCKPLTDGSLGCRDQCLNRMLNIECVKGTCPCGELCSNQQFQKRKYARLKPIPCGKKGFGLQLLQNVSRGQFLIDYVGEVLDFATYEARQRDYASRGQKHFYFMTLNGGNRCMHERKFGTSYQP